MFRPAFAYGFVLEQAEEELGVFSQDTLPRTNEAAYPGVGHRPRAVHCSFQGCVVCLVTGEPRMRARMKSWEAQAPSELFAYQEIHLSLNTSI
jgi:hypothetical protein